jgi:hypothetical protein
MERKSGFEFKGKGKILYTIANFQFPMKGEFSEETLSTYRELVKERFGASFSESEYDFTRCVRPDGTAYGTSGQCRKGTEAGVKEESKIIGNATPAQRAAMENRAHQMRSRNAQADRHALAKKVAKEMGKGMTDLEVAREVTRRQEKMAKTRELYSKTTKLKGDWQKARESEKFAKGEESRIKKETKGDKSPEARDKRLKAAKDRDKAETQVLRAQDKFFAASKALSRLTMTPEQRKEERAWDKTKRTLG